MPTVVAKGPSGVPPTTEEISSLLNTIFTAETSQQSLDGSYAVANLLIQSVGTSGLLNYNVLAETKKAATDKKNGARRESAMLIFGALFERFPREFPLSEAVFLLHNGGILDVVLDSLADKGAVVRDAAQYAIDALYACMTPEAKANALLPALEAYLGKGTGKWQGFVGGYKLLDKMAAGAQMGNGTKEEENDKDVLREAMGKTLKELIPIVESGMHDLKADVAKQAMLPRAFPCSSRPWSNPLPRPCRRPSTLCRKLLSSQSLPPPSWPFSPLCSSVPSTPPPLPKKLFAKPLLSWRT
jgi:elongation factor 3